ncbi:MAG TPA: hypothetical protein VMU20_17125 [Candidatus Dormibacteraeota bacterium]|nr:hypothetical protein [Candidatus Dormibacteraeota bacterium]
MPDLPVTPLPAEFLAALEGEEELLVSSRDPRRTGTVRAWFAVAPPGRVLLLTEAHSVKAQRWRRDPWVGLRVPGGDLRAEGTARFVTGDEVDELAPLVVDRWDMAGAPTVEGLHRILDSGTHVLVAVEGAAPAGPAEGD